MNCPKCDVFVSYRRDRDAQTARLVRSELQRRGYSVFLDVDDLRPGHFDEALLKRIREAPNFIVILSVGSLDRCTIQDDWLRREIACALDNNKKVIPIMMPGFNFPLMQDLPEEIQSIQVHHGVNYSHEFFDAMMKKVVDYLGAPDAAERKVHNLWFWFGLFFLVYGIASWVTLFHLFAYGTFEGPRGTWKPIIIQALGAIPGAILLRRSGRACSRWFWLGVTLIAIGITEMPVWLALWLNKTPPKQYYLAMDHSAAFLALWIGLESIPLILIGSFLVWRRWPRDSARHPIAEASGFVAAVCIVSCLACIAVYVLVPR
jgi:hypothetical protein